MRKNQKTSLTTYTHICIIKANAIHMEGKIEGEGHSEKNEKFMELGGIRKDIALLAISGVAVVCSLARQRRKSSGSGK